MSTTAVAEIQNPDLQPLVGGFQEAEERVTQLFRELTPTQLNWQPEPGRWSVAQCLEHLEICAEHFVPAIRTAIARNSKLRGDRALKTGWLGKLFLGFVRPDAPKPFKAPGLFKPSDQPDLSRIERVLLHSQRDFLECLERADGLDLNRIKLASPAVKVLRLNLGTWLIAMKEHQLRHLEQADRVRGTAGFPAA